MAINFDKYKTYDTTDGFGSAKQWRNSFHSRMTGEEAAEILKEARNETPWTILGISTTATAEEIKKAFKKKCMEWHPDRNQHRIEEATENMKRINAAYTILTAKKRR